MTSFVYVAGTGRGPIKIGHSRNPRTRVSNISTSSPDTIVLFIVCELGSQNEAKAAEKNLHLHFRQHRLNGEWFDLSVDQVFSAMLELKMAPLRMNLELSETSQNWLLPLMRSLPACSISRLAGIYGLRDQTPEALADFRLRQISSGRQAIYSL